MFYLCSTRSKIKDQLYPKDCEKLINSHLGYYQNKLRPKTQRLIKILQRRTQDENSLLPNETPRGQARMSVSSSAPMVIESEVEEIGRFFDVLDNHLKKSNSDFFGNQMSIADILYFWEISTVQELLKREIVSQQTSYLHKWYHETMKQTPAIAQIEAKSAQ